MRLARGALKCVSEIVKFTDRREPNGDQMRAAVRNDAAVRSDSDGQIDDQAGISWDHRAIRSITNSSVTLRIAPKPSRCSPPRVRWVCHASLAITVSSFADSPVGIEKHRLERFDRARLLQTANVLRELLEVRGADPFTASHKNCRLT